MLINVRSSAIRMEFNSCVDILYFYLCMLCMCVRVCLYLTRYCGAALENVQYRS